MLLSIISTDHKTQALRLGVANVFGRPTLPGDIIRYKEEQKYVVHTLVTWGDAHT